MRIPSQLNIVNREALVQKNRTLLATARRWVESGIKVLSPNLENSRQLKYNALFRVSPKAVPIRLRLHLEATQVVQGKSRLKYRWQNCSPILVLFIVRTSVYYRTMLSCSSVGRVEVSSEMAFPLDALTGRRGGAHAEMGLAEVFT